MFLVRCFGSTRYRKVCFRGGSSDTIMDVLGASCTARSSPSKMLVVVGACFGGLRVSANALVHVNILTRGRHCTNEDNPKPSSGFTCPSIKYVLVTLRMQTRCLEVCSKHLIQRKGSRPQVILTSPAVIYEEHRCDIRSQISVTFYGHPTLMCDPIQNN